MENNIVPSYEEISKKFSNSPIPPCINIRQVEYEDINDIKISKKRTKIITNINNELDAHNDYSDNQNISSLLQNKVVKINKDVEISYQVSKNYMDERVKYLNFEKQYLNYIKNEDKKAFINLTIATGFKEELITNLNYLKGILSEEKLEDSEIKKINNINFLNLTNEEYFNLLLQSNVVDMSKLFQLIVIHEQRNNLLVNKTLTPENINIIEESLKDLRELDMEVNVKKFKKSVVFGCTYLIQKRRLEYALNETKDNELEYIYLLTGYRRVYPLREFIELEILSNINANVVNEYYKLLNQKNIPNYFENPQDFINFLNNTNINHPVDNNILSKLNDSNNIFDKIKNMNDSDERRDLVEKLLIENGMEIGKTLSSLINRESLNNISYRMSKALFNFDYDKIITSENGNDVIINKEEKLAEEFFKNKFKDISNINQDILLGHLLHTTELNFFKLAIDESGIDKNKFKIVYSNKVTLTGGVVRSNTQDTLRVLYDKMDNNFNEMLFISNDCYVAHQKNAILDVLLEKDKDFVNKKNYSVNVIGNNPTNGNYFNISATNVKLSNVVSRLCGKYVLDINLILNENVSDLKNYNINYDLAYEHGLKNLEKFKKKQDEANNLGCR